MVSMASFIGGRKIISFFDLHKQLNVVGFSEGKSKRIPLNP